MFGDDGARLSQVRGSMSSDAHVRFSRAHIRPSRWCNSRQVHWQSGLIWPNALGICVDQIIGDDIELRVPHEVSRCSWCFLHAEGKTNGTFADLRDPVRLFTQVLVNVLPDKRVECRPTAAVTRIQLHLCVLLFQRISHFQLLGRVRFICADLRPRSRSTVFSFLMLEWCAIKRHVVTLNDDFASREVATNEEGATQQQQTSLFSTLSM